MINNQDQQKIALDCLEGILRLAGRDRAQHSMAQLIVSHMQKPSCSPAASESIRSVEFPANNRE